MNRYDTLVVLAVIVPALALPGALSRAAAETAPDGTLLTSTPLTPATGGGGQPFEMLSAEQTGVHFVNTLDADHPFRYLYHSGMSCGGVAIGDVDGDGRPDLFLVGGPGPNRLFRQIADLQFADITVAAGVDGGAVWGTGAAMADIDNDGDLDILVCNYDAPNALYINRGDGTFDESASRFGLDRSDASLLPTFCDYDRDGDLDVYVLCNHLHHPGGKPRTMNVTLQGGKPRVDVRYERSYIVQLNPANGKPFVDTYGRPDRLYRNEGNGTFTDVTRASGVLNLGFGLSATWWDYNGDGWPDLYVGNDFQDPDRLYRNNRDGTFTDVITAVVPHTTWYSMGADAGDINNDGLVDFLIADMSATTHFKQKTTMGNMSSFKWFLETARPPQYMRNAVYLNTGTRRVMEVAELVGLADTDWTWTPKLADLDNDGWLDVYVTNGTARSSNHSDLGKIEPFGKTAWDKYAHAPPRPEPNLAYRNRGDLRFEDVTAAWGLDHVGMSYAAAHVDLERDGDLDLIVVNLDEPVSVYRNNTTTGNRVIVRLVGRSSNRYGIGARVRLESDSGVQVRELHPVSGFLASNEPLVHFGVGAAQTIERLEVRWPSGHVQHFSQLGVNHVHTVTEPAGPAPAPAPAAVAEPMFRPSDRISGVRHVETPHDDFQAQPLLPNRLSQLGPGQAWGDVDGDGDDDVYVGGAAGTPGQLLKMGAAGTMSRSTVPAFAADRAFEDMGAVFIDADVDGDLDLVVVSGGVEIHSDDLLQDRLYLNRGDGLFERAGDALPTVRDSGGVVAAGDYDRDGDVDLYVGGRVIPGQYPLAPASHVLRNDGGRFVDATSTAAPGVQRTGLVTAALWSDADGDGWVDLLLTHEWGPVMFFRNESGTLVDRTADAGLDAWLGWWNGIAGRDIDADGDIDYVVSNFGLNSKYHASDGHPVLLYAGELDACGQLRLVEAEYEGSTVYPIRGRSCSSQAMPFVAEKFPTYASFAAATLEDIYSAARLDDAHRFEINVLESSLLINDGSGRFERRPLPRLAQAAPGFGVALSDVDGDGHTDIYMVQNFFSPQPETGRMDGGLSLLLTGNGDGSFMPVWPRRSGLIVEGDAKSLATVDLGRDGRPDFVVGVNDALVVAFENDMTTAGMFSVRLRGPRGNPSAIGARVRVVRRDGAVDSAEIYAGCGYLSHSPATLFFGTGRNPPAGLEVTWPDGRTTSHQPPAEPITVLRYPSQ